MDMRYLLLFLALFQLTANAQESAMGSRVDSYILNNLKELNLEAFDVSDYSIYREYDSKKTGLTHLFVQQYYEGIPIHQAELRLHLNKQNKWLLTQNTFVSNMANIEPDLTYSLSEIEAIKSACNQLNIDFAPINYRGKKSSISKVYEGVFSRELIPVMKSFFVQGQTIVPVWDITIYEADASDCWNVLIDAKSGEIVRKYNWVKHCSFSPEIACAHHSHSSTTISYNLPVEQVDGSAYNVFAIPLESPSHGDRTLEVEPHDVNASPYGWHNTNEDATGNPEYTITRGNNVHAYSDLNDSGISQGDEPDGGDSLLFDYPFDPMLEPDQNLDAATVNLFYMNNMMHDVWYHYGFDPQAGNFQANNYGEGGAGGDYVLAQAQDSSGVNDNIALNNANFYTPGDGSNPVMQMYIWDKPTNPYDLFTVNSPDSNQGVYEVSLANDWGGEVTSVPITADLEIVDDGSTYGYEGCGELLNDLTGKIALVSRGTCEFGLKSLNAQNAGAVAIIIYNNVGGMVDMGAGADGGAVTIPSIFLGKLDGEALRDQIANGESVNATIVNNSPEGPDYLDGDFDNGIIAHEYGHGISSRLAGSNCLFGDEQAGEGWSDFFALMMTSDDSDNAEEPHGIGTYVSAELNDGRGIRSYPYSRDMSVNPMTYDYIITESVPHGVGSVWATILWDLHWNLVDLYGYDNDKYHGTGGNNMVMQLVIDGLKLQPCQSTFIDLRNSIVTADSLLYEGQHKCLIWETFARRGVGYSANGGSSASRSDGTEAFDNLPECAKELKIDKSAKDAAKAGDAILYSIVITNYTDELLSNVTIQDTLQSDVQYAQGSSSCQIEDSGNVLSFTLGDMASGQSIECTYEVTTDDQFYSDILFEDDMEDGDDNWFVSSEQDLFWEISNDYETYSGNDAWFITNWDTRFESHLDLVSFVVEGEKPCLSFWHKYITEPAFDGGYVTISTDNISYEEVADKILRGHYRGVSQGSPPLGGKNSFWGNSNGFMNTIIDLSDYMGQEISVRFSFVADEENDAAASVEGWTIDDVRIIDMYSIENNACVRSSSNSIINCDDIDNAGTIMYDHYGVSVEEQLDNVFVQLYPNPASNTVQIRLSGNWLNEINYTVYNVQGKIINKDMFVGSELRISTKEFPDGMYFIELNDSERTSFKKITIQH